MNDQASNWVRFAPGNPVLKGVNRGGLKTLYIKQVRRFFKEQMQTLRAPSSHIYFTRTMSSSVQDML